MLDKSKEPSKEEIEEWIGQSAKRELDEIIHQLNTINSVSISLVFPFGKEYGWGYRIGYGKEMLCYLFFEKGAITAMLSITSKKVKAMEALYPSLSPKIKDLWDHRYTCGSGGWIHVRIENIEDTRDVLNILSMKMGNKEDKK